MTNLNERICNHCGKAYSLEYTSKVGYVYMLDTLYCSKSCASKERTNKGCILPDIGSEALENKAMHFIAEQNRYCSGDEICTAIGHSSKSLTKHGILVSTLNEKLGFTKPASMFQETVSEILHEQFANVEVEKKFDGLVGITGYPLRVDFYLPEINAVVEADGNQHSDPEHPWHAWNNGTVASYDKIKDEFFREKGIRVFRVPYKRNLKKEDVLSRLS